ncbi:MAG: leucine-rich repeat domain-containing protein [Nannocystaceae bacterium]
MPNTRLLSNLLTSGSLAVVAALTAGCLGTPERPDTESDAGTDTVADTDAADTDGPATTGDVATTGGVDTTGDDATTDATPDTSTTDDDPPAFRYDLADCPEGDAIELLVPGRAELVAHHDVNLVWRKQGAVARVQAWLSADMGKSFPYLIADVDAGDEALQVAPWDSTQAKIDIIERTGAASPLAYKIAVAAFDADDALIGCSVGARDFEIRGWPDAAAERLDDLIIPDSALAAAIEARYDDPGLRATQVTALAVKDQGVAELLGLAHLPLIRDLTIEREEVTTVAELSWMKDLRQLTLHSDPLSPGELPLLSGLLNLESLTLDGLDLGDADLDALPRAAGLAALSLAQNAITSPAALPVYDDLESLSLDRNAIADLTGFPAYPGLAQLRLSDNALVDLAGLPALPHLAELDLRDNKIGDLSGLVAAPELFDVMLRDNALTDLASLPALANLDRLNVNHNALVTLADTPTLPSLIELSLAGNSLKSAAGLPSQPNLRILRLDDNALSGLDGLPVLPALEVLMLSGNDIADLSALTKYPKLTTLVLDSNAIEHGILTLTELPNLTYLSLADNPTIPCILQNTVEAEILAAHPDATVILSTICYDP